MLRLSDLIKAAPKDKDPVIVVDDFTGWDVHVNEVIKGVCNDG